MLSENSAANRTSARARVPDSRANTTVTKRKGDLDPRIGLDAKKVMMNIFEFLELGFIRKLDPIAPGPSTQSVQSAKTASEFRIRV